MSWTKFSSDLKLFFVGQFLLPSPLCSCLPLSRFSIELWYKNLSCFKVFKSSVNPNQSRDVRTTASRRRGSSPDRTWIPAAEMQPDHRRLPGFDQENEEPLRRGQGLWNQDTRHAWWSGERPWTSWSQCCTFWSQKMSIHIHVTFNNWSNFSFTLKT